MPITTSALPTNSPSTTNDFSLDEGSGGKSSPFCGGWLPLPLGEAASGVVVVGETETAAFLVADAIRVGVLVAEPAEGTVLMGVEPLTGVVGAALSTSVGVLIKVGGATDVFSGMGCDTVGVAVGPNGVRVAVRALVGVRIGVGVRVNGNVWRSGL